MISKTNRGEESRAAFAYESGLTTILPKALALGLGLLVVNTAAQALTIQALPADLPDVVTGVDRWRVSFTLDLGGTVISGDQGFTIYFPSSGYSNLITRTSPSGWDVITIDPVTTPIALDGLLDALALVDNPAVSTPFVVEFDWLAQGRPGTHAYELYSLVPDFRITGSGSTHIVTVGVPEGGVSVIGSLAAVLLPAVGLRYFHRSRRPALG